MATAGKVGGAKLLLVETPSHGDIATRAYLIYEREGRPPGRDIAHWLAAEAELGVYAAH